MSDSNRVRVEPMDEHNRRLVDRVHPSDWKNPVPKSRYHLVVVGAGTAGLVAAAGAAGLGARVALVERHLMGGDCLNTGCVPSKAILRSAHAAAEFRNASRYGVRVAGVAVDFPAVMERMRRLRADISHADSAERFTQECGVEVFLGNGKFTGPDTLDVDGTTLRFSRAVIATGARAASLPIEGLDTAGHLTNETVFSLTALPRRLAVIGGGPIGCEMAQAFRAFGSEVTVIDVAAQILGREDSDAARVLQARMESEGIRFMLHSKIRGVSVANGEKVVEVVPAHLDELGRAVDAGRAGARPSQTEFVGVDEILVAVGRTPNVDGLGLEAAGVAYDRVKGVRVSDELQTTNPRIFAAGDVCMAQKFTHAADFAARIVIQNALFSAGRFGRKKLSALTIPWCTYTQPEVAHVGLYEREARERGLQTQTFVQEMAQVDRAITDGDTDGFAKILTEKRSGRILGATLVARNAGDLISEVTLAMTQGVTLSQLANVIHPYPTQADALRKLGDQYNRTRLTSVIRKWMRRYLNWRF